MITKSQRGEILRASNAIFKTKKIDRSKALTAAWMAFKCEDIFALMLVRRYASKFNRKTHADYGDPAANKKLSLFNS